MKPILELLIFASPQVPKTMALPKYSKEGNGSNELDSLVLTNNKPKNLSGSENAIIMTIEKYFKRFNYVIGIVITKIG